MKKRITANRATQNIILWMRGRVGLGYYSHDKVRMLLGKGADVSLISKNGETAREIATRKGHVAAVALLVAAEKMAEERLKLWLKENSFGVS